MLVAVRGEAVTLGAWHAFGALQYAFVAPTLCCKVGVCLPRAAVAFDTVGLPHGDCAVVQAVIQRLAKGQDVFNFDFGAKQHAGADMHAAVRAAAVGHVKAEFFPQNPFLNITVFDVVRLYAAQIGNFLPNALSAFLVIRLFFLCFQLLFSALL